VNLLVTLKPFVNPKNNTQIAPLVFFSLFGLLGREIRVQIPDRLFGLWPFWQDRIHRCFSIREESPTGKTGKLAWDANKGRVIYRSVEI